MGEAILAIGVGGVDDVMTMPAFAEVAAEPRRLDRESPLIVTGRTAKDRGFGDESATNLADDALQRHAGKRPDVFENEPRTRMRAHLLDHLFREVLRAMVALSFLPPTESSAGYAGNRVTVPHLAGQRAERAEPRASGDLDGVLTGRHIVIEFSRGLRVGRRQFRGITQS